MPVLTQPLSHSLVVGPPPCFSNWEQDERARPKRAAKTGFPVPRKNQLEINRHRTLSGEPSQIVLQEVPSDGRVVDRKSVWNHVHVDQTQPHIQSLTERRGKLQSS